MAPVEKLQSKSSFRPAPNSPRPLEKGELASKRGFKRSCGEHVSYRNKYFSAVGENSSQIGISAPASAVISTKKIGGPGLIALTSLPKPVIA